ncbi:MAG: 30S ribosomal protein S12 methylthiotransferase RimO, partial [bacterium]
NKVDAELISGIMMQNGWVMTPDAEIAKCIIINTCSFLESSRDEASNVIEYYSEIKKRINCKLIITGCLPERDNEHILSRFPMIDAIIGINGYSNIHNFAGKISDEDIEYIPDFSGEYNKEQYITRPLSSGHGWAYLKIADGCDNCCTYCAIPGIRGKYHSRPLQDVIDEAKSLVNDRNVKEIILIAQDTSNYGIDTTGLQQLSILLDELENIPNLQWIRIMYTHPAHVSGEIIAAMSRNKKVLPYIDMPLQHISERILSDMNRKISKDETIKLIQKLKTLIPDITIRTTFIVGFPGETAEEFDELYDFIKDMKFPRLGVFRYSAEPGTPAYSMKNQVNSEISEERFNAIMELQQKITKNWANKLIGKELDIILDTPSEEELYPGYRYSGRSIHDSPDVDGLVVLRNIAGYSPGDIIKVKINKNFIYDIGGYIINPR